MGAIQIVMKKMHKNCTILKIYITLHPIEVEKIFFLDIKCLLTKN